MCYFLGLPTTPPPTIFWDDLSRILPLVKVQTLMEREEMLNRVAAAESAAASAQQVASTLVEELEELRACSHSHVVIGAPLFFIGVYRDL